MMNTSNIIIITPVRNEEKYLPVTMECMCKQTIKPCRWIIVNDGSTDKTEEVILKYKKAIPFIKYISLPNRGYRKPGAGVIEAFNIGFNSIDINDWDVVAKFDGDLMFPTNTLEIVVNAFCNNSKLGVTGGTRYEKKTNNGHFKKVIVPNNFVGGPYKFYRKKCFYEIGKLIERAGWDGVDTVKANMKGWDTGEIGCLRILHLKPTGTSKGEGLRKACEKYGDVSYYMGGYFWYFILRAFCRSIEGQNFKVGYYMLRGYSKAMINRDRINSKEFRKYLRKKQINNVIHYSKNLGS